MDEGLNPRMERGQQLQNLVTKQMQEVAILLFIDCEKVKTHKHATKLCQIKSEQVNWDQRELWSCQGSLGTWAF